MTFEELKRRIYQDNKIVLILEKLGCKFIKTEQNGSLITASLPNGDNKRSVQVKNNESLTTYIRSKGIKGSLLDLVSYIKEWDDLIKTKEWVCNTCNYNKFTVIEKPNPIQWLKKLRREREKIENKNKSTELRILPNCILNQYINIPHVLFSNDNISPNTQEEFGVRFDPLNDRIVFPIPDLQGNLVGVKGRTTLTEEEIAKRKYLYLYPTYQSVLLFNYHRALPYIKELNEVIVVESEKAVMQLWEMGIKNVVALGCKDVSENQIQLLKELQVNIVLAYDKGIEINFLKEKYQKLGIFRNVYTLYDSDNLLLDKQSPSDIGVMIWMKLYGKKIKLF